MRYNVPEEVLEMMARADEEYEAQRELEWLRENEWVEEQIARTSPGYVPLDPSDGEYTINEPIYEWDCPKSLLSKEEQ